MSNPTLSDNVFKIQWLGSEPPLILLENSSSRILKIDFITIAWEKLTSWLSWINFFGFYEIGFSTSKIEIYFKSKISLNPWHVTQNDNLEIKIRLIQYDLVLSNLKISGFRWKCHVRCLTKNIGHLTYAKLVTLPDFFAFNAGNWAEICVLELIERKTVSGKPK